MGQVCAAPRAHALDEGDDPSDDGPRSRSPASGHVDAKAADVELLESAADGQASLVRSRSPALAQRQIDPHPLPRSPLPVQIDPLRPLRLLRIRTSRLPDTNDGALNTDGSEPTALPGIARLPSEVVLAIWRHVYTRPSPVDADWQHSEDVLDVTERSRSLRILALVCQAWRELAQPMLDSVLLITRSSSQHRAIRRLLKAGRGEAWRWIVADYSSAWRKNGGAWRWKQVTPADKATYKLTLSVLAAAVNVHCVTLPLSNDLAADSIPASCTDLRVGAITQAIVAAHRDPARIESIRFEQWSYWSDHETMPLSCSLDRLTTLVAPTAQARLVPFLQAATNLHTLRLGTLWPVVDALASLADCVNVSAVSASLLIDGEKGEAWAHELVTRLPGQVATVSLRVLSLAPVTLPDDFSNGNGGPTVGQADRLGGIGRVAGALAKELRSAEILPALTTLRLAPIVRFARAAECARDLNVIALSAVCARRGIVLDIVL